MRRRTHLLHKAQGLEESLEPGTTIPNQTLDSLETRMAVVQVARDPLPHTAGGNFQPARPVPYRCLYEQLKTVFHKQTRELATEMRKDREALFRVLQYPPYTLDKQRMSQHPAGARESFRRLATRCYLG